MKISKSTILLFTIAILLLSNVSNSQVSLLSKSSNSDITNSAVKYKPAAFIVEWDFSFNQPMPQAYGELGEFFTFQNYGLKFGVGSHINMKLTADKKGKVRPYVSLGYDLLMNNNGKQAYIGANTTNSFPFSGDSTGSPVAGTSKLWMHVFSGALGFEYAIPNRTKWTPYFNLDVGLNMIFGTYRQTTNTTPETSFTIKQAARFGGSIGAGVDGRLTRVFGIAAGIRFRLANLTKSSSLSTDLNKFELDDAANASLNNKLSSGRSIDYFTFYIGATFYVGKK